MLTENKCSIRIYCDPETERKMFSYESELNEQLMKHGVRVSCSPSRNQGRKGLTAYVLSITIDKEVTSRGAGRKEKKTCISIEEAINMESGGYNASQIAETMGVSIATYYRRRKHFLQD